MTETLDTQSDTMDLINTEPVAKIAKVRKPKNPIVFDPDQPKQSIRGRPKKAIDESLIVKEKGPKGRPKIPDYVRKITPPEYFVDYYHAKGCCEVECPNCKRFVTRSNISKHKKSLFCRDYTAPAI